MAVICPFSSTVNWATTLSCRNSPSGSFFAIAYQVPLYCKKIRKAAVRPRTMETLQPDSTEWRRSQKEDHADLWHHASKVYLRNKSSYFNSINPSIHPSAVLICGNTDLFFFFVILPISAAVQYMDTKFSGKRNNNWQILPDQCTLFSLQQCLKTPEYLFFIETTKSVHSFCYTLQFETSLLKLSFCSIPLASASGSVKAWTSHTSAVSQYHSLWLWNATTPVLLNAKYCSLEGAMQDITDPGE